MQRKYWTTGEEKYLRENWGIANKKQIMKYLNRSLASINSKASRMGLKDDINYHHNRRYNGKEYALYKGEDLLVIGTMQEISKRMNLKYKTLLTYKTPKHLNDKTENGTVLIALDY